VTIFTSAKINDKNCISLIDNDVKCISETRAIFRLHHKSSSAEFAVKEKHE